MFYAKTIDIISSIISPGLNLHYISLQYHMKYFISKAVWIPQETNESHRVNQIIPVQQTKPKGQIVPVHS